VVVQVVQEELETTPQAVVVQVAFYIAVIQQLFQDLRL
jgi:hypothetical protein